MDEIRNKVKESGLIQLDLADFKPSDEILNIDISVALWQGMILKEKDFRSWLKDHNWEQYKGKGVYIHCSADAIIPTWAYMLIAAQLEGIAKTWIIGSKEDLIKEMIRQNMRTIQTDDLQEGRIIIKGCSDIPYPDFAMVELMKIIQPLSKSIMYGEPCSTVPVFKRN
jgi:hypothetical protein